jgi:cellulose synthase/poly-beta-1,6-N-acetylglucosamine synthase-like glycosyltransferase
MELISMQNKAGSIIVAALNYYPVRYYAAAFFFAYIFLSNIQFFTTIEDSMLVAMLHFFRISSYYFGGDFLIGTFYAPSHVVIPVVVQLVFLIFFPTIAITSRTNLERRARILLFGLLCFVVFVLIHFLLLLIFGTLGQLASPLAFYLVSIFATRIIGGLIIESTIFFTATRPVGPKIKPAIRKSYLKEYAYFGASLVISFSIFYLFLGISQADISSPILAIILLRLNLSPLFFQLIIPNIFYELKKPDWLRWTNSAHNKAPSISFLIAAYNEEKMIGKCIRSIEKASSHYRGRVELILVNDGSTDRTGKIIRETAQNLKYCDCKLFDIPNSGKGYALKYGLQRTSGDIIFRTDADTVLDEYCLPPMMNHFRNPQVGCVSGWILAFESNGIWLKAQNLMNCWYLLTKRGQSVFDSIIVQPGSSTAYRREALEKAGGWVDNIFGEDGELTSRVIRNGYKGEIEQRSILYTEMPRTLQDFIQQRRRWSVAYYHSRGRNLKQVLEIRTPRSFVFLWNLFRHGVTYANSLLWTVLLAIMVTGVSSTSQMEQSLLKVLPALVGIYLIYYGTELTLIAYYLHKFRMTHDVIYFPVMKFLSFVITQFIKPQVMEIVLSWSSKWPRYSTEAFKDLRKEVNRRIDPGYPSGQVQPSGTSKKKIDRLDSHS